MTIPNKLQITSNWSTLEDKPLTRESLAELFANGNPCVRHKGFLSPEECERMVEIVHETKFGHYDPDLIFPLLSSVGITQFDYAQDMGKYFSLVEPARSLQDRFIREVGVDIIARVKEVLHGASGLPVRLARQDDKEYFAGILRVVEGNFIAPHADFGPFSDKNLEVGKIVSQITWNVLLKSVPGGETLVHDRPWQGASDNKKYQKERPRYAYSPKVFEGCISKVIAPIEGDLTFFNSRNFHEVMHIDHWNGKDAKEARYTLSCFVGLLPEEAGGPCLILWS